MNVLVPQLIFNGDAECTKAMLTTISGIALNLSGQRHRKVKHYLHNATFTSLQIVFDDEDGALNDLGDLQYNGRTLNLTPSRTIRTYKKYKQLETVKATEQ